MAQNYEDALRQNPLKLAGSFYVYDYADVPALIPAPEGYAPFYVSHFGRHGARYCTKEYDRVYDWFAKASEAGQLTAYGKAFFAGYDPFYQRVKYCGGNLTDLGKQQHRSIAAHMYERFPEIFEGPTRVEAVSTEAPRVIMSMWSFLQQLQALDSDMSVHADASAKFAPWLQPNLPASPYFVKAGFKCGKETDNAVKAHFEKYVPWKSIAEKFFTSSDVVETLFKTTPEKFISTLHGVITGTRCLDEGQGCFDDVLTSEELYQIWKGQSARFLVDVGNYAGSESMVLDYAAFTLGQIIESADDDIAKGSTQLRLRFGHDAGLAPLLACMNVNGFGRETSSFDEGMEIYSNFNVPMGSSLQLIFYKNTLGDVLVKALLNEQEAALPFEAVHGPYYRWSDFKEYYMPKVKASKEKVQSRLVVAPKPAPKNVVNVIPYPAKLDVSSGEFCVYGADVYYDKAFDEKARKVVSDFAGRLGAKCSRSKGKIRNGIHFIYDGAVAKEAYSVDVTAENVIVKASSREGIFYAVQTLKQLLPTEVYGTSPVGQGWSLPCVSIADAPEFAYRGMMLDVSRHFFSVEEVKKFIDMMSVYKLNRLHWHLTDDQGWRIEIKKYPKLTEVGGWRNGTMLGKDFESNDGIRYGGFYTQEQIREIVQYADERCVTVIPEIDLPGHMLAALTAYPELGCTGGPYQVWHKWGISSQVMNPVKEETLAFLKDVLSEVADLFPSEYIHIGGDECPTQEWETNVECQAFIAKMGFVDDEVSSAEKKLQFWLTEQLQSYLAEEKGKKMIGWQEVLGCNLAETSAIMSWTSRVKGIQAAKAGIDVIMCPSYACYFDYSQSADIAAEPLSISKDARRIVTVPKCYALDPYENIPADKQKHILGAQANIWTEYIASDAHLEYMLLPRLAALSEVCWLKHSDKDIERLKASLVSQHFKMYEILGYNFRSAVDF